MALISSSSSSVAPTRTTSTGLPASLSPKPLVFLRVGSSRPTLLFKRAPSLLLSRSADNGAGAVTSNSTTVLEEVQQEEEDKKEEAAAPSPAAPTPEVEQEKKQESVASNGSAVKVKAKETAVAEPPIKFKDPRWVGGTWDLTQFQKSGRTDWDAVIDAEARRRKWLEENPEASTTEEPVIFDTSIIPWWCWIKRFHLPEAEKLNGRAAMVGFFMAYFVDSLTGVGLVDQMGNFFCKTLLFVAVLGVLFIRKNEDFETLKKLYEETTFYDKQWQATWQEEKSSSSDSNN